MRRRSLLSASSGGIDPTTGRGTIGNYEVVDLGLSNGLLFATCNLGATEETGYGGYYYFGGVGWAYTGSEDPVPSIYDIVTHTMGEGWRTPTQYEFQYLMNETNYSWTTINGINGGKFTSKTNPNAYVFFPAAGYYNDYYQHKDENSGSHVWSSSPSRNSGSPEADSLLCYGEEVMSYWALWRTYRVPVRGVHAAV
jgi:hypothetical protein